MTKLKYSLFLGFVAASTFHSVYAQESIPEWSTLFQESGVTIAKQFKHCDVPEDGLYADYYMLRMQNTTDKPVTISWKNQTYYNGECTSCEGRENIATEITLEPGATVSGECRVGSDPRFKIFVRWTRLPNKRTLTSFHLANLTIVPKTSPNE